MDEGSKLSKNVMTILDLLKKEYPDTQITLRFKNPLELLVATILSAQCTDATVNKVTQTLFKRYTSAEDYANAALLTLEKDIKPTGFYRKKAKRLKEGCSMLVERFDSKVPRTMKELISLPGVARKTANIVLSNAFYNIEGIAVDTHVFRLSRRLGLTESKTSDRVEKDLMKIIPKENWARFTDLLIFHGRHMCKAKKPNCIQCTLNRICPSACTFDSMPVLPSNLDRNNLR